MEKTSLEKIRIRMGDITRIEADAVVNAANPSLSGGAGVDGMIHWAAGSGLAEECLSIGGCPTGEARLTGGYNLPARHIIHTVGPVYGVDRENSPRLLASCYRNCLQLAAAHNLKTIAFPAVSCGVYGYPAEEACRIAVDTTLAFLNGDTSIERVTFVLYSCREYDIYMDYFKSIKDRNGRS